MGGRKVGQQEGRRFGPLDWHCVRRMRNCNLSLICIESRESKRSRSNRHRQVRSVFKICWQSRSWRSMPMPWWRRPRMSR